MTPEERQEIREQVEFAVAHGSSSPLIHATARLLADYDHLVEVAREVVESWMKPNIRNALTFDEKVAALRALIDPATPDEESDPYGIDAFLDRFDPDTPEPVEGEPHA